MQYDTELRGMNLRDTKMRDTKMRDANLRDTEHSDTVPHPHRVISIVGPTASGKTGLGVALAQALAQRGERAEIINADAYQMYRYMDIGTAKASPDEQRQVPHHLLDIFDPSESMSVAWFQQLARNCIAQLQRQSIRPILVGGSGLYARAAVDDIDFPQTDPEVRARIEQRAQEIGSGALFQELERKDPEAARHMDARNTRRIVRALEVIEITGEPFSAHLPKYRYVIPCVQIGLDIPREVLDQLVDKRTRAMRQAGLVDEVRRVRPMLGKTASRTLGYSEIISYLDGEISEDEAFALIAQHTKRLARKQMGWFGRDPRIHWLNATSSTLLEEALDIVERADAGEYDEADSNAEAIVHHLGQIAQS